MVYACGPDTCNSHSDCGSSSDAPVRKSVQAASTTANPFTSNISEPLHTLTKYGKITKISPIFN
jgi:hypothetical protein